MELYKGIIIEESLLDNRIITDLERKDVKISKEEEPSERWHLYSVYVSEEDIEKLSKNIKEKWYMHFWKNKKVIAIFKDKKFEFDYDDKSTWQDAIDYGLKIGIPKEQLDFPID
jgi:hypothetical protein